MSRSSDLAIELSQLEDAAAKAAEGLAQALQRISDLHWQQESDGPVFRASRETLGLLKEIELRLATPIGEIEAAA